MASLWAKKEGLPSLAGQSRSVMDLVHKYQKRKNDFLLERPLHRGQFIILLKVDIGKKLALSLMQWSFQRIVVTRAQDAAVHPI